MCDSDEQAMILTLDALIAALEIKRAEKGGEVQVAVDDSDTDWHMKIEEIKWSRRFPDRLLIRGAGYADGAYYEDSG